MQTVEERDREDGENGEGNDNGAGEDNGEREEGEVMVKVREDVDRNMEEERSGEKREDRGEEGD